MHIVVKVWKGIPVLMSTRFILCQHSLVKVISRSSSSVKIFCNFAKITFNLFKHLEFAVHTSVIFLNSVMTLTFNQRNSFASHPCTSYLFNLFVQWQNANVRGIWLSRRYKQESVFFLRRKTSHTSKAQHKTNSHSLLQNLQKEKKSMDNVFLKLHTQETWQYFHF